MQQQPDLWLWLGDNIYGDTEDLAAFQQKYELQKQQPGYRQLLQTCPVTGIWDDHDYGHNNAGRDFRLKEQTKELFLNFLDVPDTAGIRNRPGIYQSFVFGSGREKVKVILLDVRTFREEPKDWLRLRILNKNATLLGEAQWEWLENELENSDAAIHIIASGSQVLPYQHHDEKWADYPLARKRLLRLLAQHQPARTILLTGDRHKSEISRFFPKNGAETIYEITSSGLTHNDRLRKEKNRYRVGKQIAVLNYGLLEINWDAQPLQVRFKIMGEQNKVLIEHLATFQR